MAKPVAAQVTVQVPTGWPAPTVALIFNGLFKKHISKLTILITGTFSILHEITQKVCGKQ